ncbi:hypothetical protein R5M92_09835 [Halomonas sp. Bachu 37]|uniref:hypothetical protein n=1 Tax=Halomonas kashgarensis TaxID=3084920 RepID=UPI0032164F2C
MYCRTYRNAWIQGFLDGEQGKRHQTLKGIPGFRYTNGWIEGHAKLLGYEYRLIHATEQELDHARTQTDLSLP